MSMLILNWMWIFSFIMAGGGGHGRGVGIAPWITDQAGLIIRGLRFFITGCRPDGDMLIKSIVLKTGIGIMKGYLMINSSITGVTGKRTGIGINKIAVKVTIVNTTGIRAMKRATETDGQQSNQGVL